MVEGVATGDSCLADWKMMKFRNSQCNARVSTNSGSAFFFSFLIINLFKSDQSIERYTSGIQETMSSETAPDPVPHSPLKVTHAPNLFKLLMWTHQWEQCDKAGPALRY
jgi:hypothetical protein